VNSKNSSITPETAPRTARKPSITPKALGKTVRAFSILGEGDIALPAGWTPFACTGFTIYAFKESK
jgi:hypothetical protein